MYLTKCTHDYYVQVHKVLLNGERTTNQLSATLGMKSTLIGRIIKEMLLCGYVSRTRIVGNLRRFNYAALVKEIPTYLGYVPKKEGIEDPENPHIRTVLFNTEESQQKLIEQDKLIRKERKQQKTFVSSYYGGTY